MENTMTNIKNKVSSKLVPMINEFQRYQCNTGAVINELPRAEKLLDEIISVSSSILKDLSQENYATHLIADLNEWKKRGLNKEPFFDNSLANFVVPKDGETTFCLAAITTPNSGHQKGYWLECFLVHRKEPAVVKEIEAEIPHPKNVSQTVCLLSSSFGFSTGRCLVFFPENVKTKEKITNQSFALFFFDKFHKIYTQDTICRAENIFNLKEICSKEIDEESCYAARTVWGYLHDYYHHCGTRPFDRNIHVKMNFWAGILEEIKVDCKTIMTLQERKYPWWQEITEFILFERLARYPAQHDATRNFDSATGVFLFTWLKRNNFSFSYDTAPDKPVLNLNECLKGIRILVNEIEELEIIEDDAAFKKAVEYYVKNILTPGTDGQKYNIPEDYTVHSKNMGIKIPELHFQ